MIIFVIEIIAKLTKKIMRIRLATEDDKYIIAKFQVKMAKETENIDLDPEIVENGVMSVFQDSHTAKTHIDTIGICITRLQRERSF